MNAIRTPRTESVEIGSGTDPLPTWREKTKHAGGVAVCSIWEPTDDEREAIAQGANVMLAVYRDPPPLVAMRIVAGPDAERIAANPVDDAVTPEADLNDVYGHGPLGRLRRWWADQQDAAMARLDARRTRFRPHHGERPRMPGWRRGE